MPGENTAWGHSSAGLALSDCTARRGGLEGRDAGAWRLADVFPPWATPPDGGHNSCLALGSGTPPLACFAPEGRYAAPLHTASRPAVALAPWKSSECMLWSLPEAGRMHREGPSMLGAGRDLG